MSSSISDANPKLHQSIIDMEEDEKKKLCYGLDIKRLFPNDLKESCSCGDCDKKIKDLLDFDNDVIFLSKLIWDHIDEVNIKENICLSLHCASHWNKWMLDFLHNNLKSICEESGNPLTLEKSPKLENAYEQLTQHLISAKVLNANAFDFQSVEPYDIFKDIDAGSYWYGETEAKAKALPLLEEIRMIAKNHKAAKKSARKNKTTLDPSLSKDYIVQQIECLENMPVDVLQAEVEDLVDQICPVVKHMKMFMGAQKYVTDTCVSMINEINEFWLRNFENQVKEHSSNGLDKILDLLLIKVDLFKKGWEYAHAFTSFDRSNPKRQRIA